ncbi:MAG: hypothetical protein IT280_12435 [Ignavibacteria bacterium]|nr:hypothetical protein [Ignavibacteria bacterium]
MEHKNRKNIETHDEAVPKAVVTVDNKGQMSLSREIREILRLVEGGKAALFVRPRTDDSPAVASIVNANDLKVTFIREIYK